MELLLPPEGDVVAEHRATYASRVLCVLFMVLPGLGLAAMAAQDENLRAPFSVFAALFLGLGALAIAQQNKTKGVLRADGVERWGLRGKLWALRFADMTELRYRVVKIRVYHFIPAGTYIYLTFTDPKGSKHKLPANLKAMDVLAERIADQQTSARFAEARARIDQGDPVTFGKWMTIDKEKLSARKLFGGTKTCPLPEIEKVFVDNGVLRIRQKGKMFAFASLMVGSVPNVFLLLRLLSSLLPEQTAARASVA